jgi:hypothetical protein
MSFVEFGEERPLGWQTFGIFELISVTPYM